MKKIRMMMAAALAILASCSTTKSGESTANPLSSKVIVAYRAGTPVHDAY